MSRTSSSGPFDGSPPTTNDLRQSGDIDVPPRAADCAARDAELARFLDAWPSLSDADKARILAIVDEPGPTQ